MSDNFLISNEFIPEIGTNSKFKRQRNAGVTSCNFLFCVFNPENFSLKKIADFKSVSGINVSLEDFKLQDNRLRMEHNVPGKETFEQIQLSRGFGAGNFVRQWYIKSSNSYSYMADAAIVILDNTFTNVFRFVVLKDCWISNYNFSAIDRDADNEELIESIVLKHKGFAFCDFDTELDVGDINSNNNTTYRKSSYFYADTDEILGYGRPFAKIPLTIEAFLNTIY